MMHGYLAFIGTFFTCNYCLTNSRRSWEIECHHQPRDWSCASKINLIRWPIRFGNFYGISAKTPSAILCFHISRSDCSVRTLHGLSLPDSQLWAHSLLDTVDMIYPPWFAQQYLRGSYFLIPLHCLVNASHVFIRRLP